jgi:hypothetical protein
MNIRKIKVWRKIRIWLLAWIISEEVKKELEEYRKKRVRSGES